MGRAGAQAFVVLACAFAIVACGGSDKQTEGCGPSHPAHARIYRALPKRNAPVTPARVAATVDALCSRVGGRLASAKVSVHKVGADRIEVGSKAPLGPSADRLAGGRARLAFYDWEPNLRPANQAQPTLSLSDAVQKASKQRPTADRDDIPAAGPSDAVKKQLGGDEKRIEQYYDRQNDAATPAPAGSLLQKVPRGIVVLKDEARAGSAGPLGYWILEDDAELTSADITDPKQEFDQQTNEPIVTFNFTDKGRAAFARVTKREAVRGQNILRGPGQTPQDTFQRFAIALDNQLVSLATISYIDNPEGIPGDTGAQINGIGDIQETQDLAKSLAYAPLPLDLKLIGVR
jgi:preprotein translocase subunit SecD